MTGEFKQGIPKEIEAILTDDAIRPYCCPDGIEGFTNFDGWVKERLAPAIAELESSATARALAAAAEEVGELFDLMRRDGIPPGNPDKQHVVGLILALTPCEARLAYEKSISDAVMEEHKNHSGFLTELYAIIVDPVMDSGKNEADLVAELLQVAKDQRQAFYDMHCVPNGRSDTLKLAKEISEHFTVDWGANDIDGTESFTVDIPKIVQILNRELTWSREARLREEIRRVEIRLDEAIWRDNHSAAYCEEMAVEQLERRANVKAELSTLQAELVGIEKK